MCDSLNVIGPYDLIRSRLGSVSPYWNGCGFGGGSVSLCGWALRFPRIRILSIVLVLCSLLSTTSAQHICHHAPCYDDKNGDDSCDILEKKVAAFYPYLKSLPAANVKNLD